MRPRAFDSVDGSYIVGTGTAQSIGEAEHDKPAGRLFVPDPEQRHGWREHYVNQPPKPGARPIGFRRKE